MLSTTPPPAGFESERPLPESARRRFAVAARAVEIMNRTVPYIPEAVAAESVVPQEAVAPEQVAPIPAAPAATDGRTLDIAALQQMVEDIHAQKDN